MAKHMMNDRRHFDRYDVALPIKVKLGQFESSKRILKGITLDNICGGGAFIQSKRTLSTKSSAEIELILPFRSDKVLNADGLSVYATGKILRYEKKGFAVQFDETSKCYIPS